MGVYSINLVKEDIMETKKCTHCELEKELSEFYMQNNKYISICKTCIIEKAKQNYRLKHPNIKKQKLTPEEQREKNRKDKQIYKITHREKYLAEKRRYYEKHKDKIKEYNIQYKRKKNNGQLYNWQAFIRNKLYRFVMEKNAAPVIEFFIQCPRNQFKEYLESLFEEGMTWENYGRGKSDENKWQLDHYIPISYFDLTNAKQALICWNFRNLRPSWLRDNLGKSTTIPDDHLEFIAEIEKYLGF